MAKKEMKDTKLVRGVSGFARGFKDFISRGNVVDMAVGVVIGGAFGKIVTSLVNDIIMPAVGMLFGALKFTDLKYVIREAVTETVDGVEKIVTPEAAITYGNFIQNVVDFLIVAFCIFLFVRFISVLRAKSIAKEEQAKAQAAAKEAEAAAAAAAAAARRDEVQEEILATLKEMQKK